MTLLVAPAAAERAGLSPVQFAARIGLYLTPHDAPGGGVAYDRTELDALLALPPLQRDPAGTVSLRESAAMISADTLAMMRGEETAPLFRLVGHMLDKDRAGPFADPIAATIWALMADLACFLFVAGHDAPEIRNVLAKHRPMLAEAAQGNDSLAFAIGEGGELVVIPGTYAPAPLRVFGLSERKGRNVLHMHRNPSDMRAAITERWFS